MNPILRQRLAAFTEWAGIALPVLCSPLLLFPRQRLLWVAAVIPFSWVLRLRTKGWLFESTSLNPLLLFLALMVGVSMYATFDLQFSLGKVCGAILGVLVYLGLTQFAITHARLRWLTAGFLAGGTALMAASLAGTAWWAKLPFLDRLVSLFPVRFKGLPGAEEGFNPNAVGGSLILFLPLVLTLAAHFMRPQNREHRGQKLALAGILFLLFAMGGTLLLSQSRGAWLGFCSGVALLLFVRYRWFRWTSIITAVTGLTTALIYKPWLGWAQPQGNGFVAGTEMSFAARLEIWTRAIYGVQDFPFTGMGMNAFRKVVNVLYPLFTISPETDISNSHNQLLQTALDLGIPGLVAYVAIWAATFWMLWRIWRKTQDTFHRALASGLAAGLIAQFVFGINDATALGAKVGVFWWIALALAASLDRLERNGSREAAQSTRTTGRAWELPLLWILVSLVSISFVGDHPYLALGFAILGGSYLGFEAVRTFQPG